MYNRYIPQPDGSFRRRQIPDPKTAVIPQPPPTPSERTQETFHAEKEMASSAGHTCRQCPNHPSNHAAHREHPKNMGIAPFLKQILPRDFDTGDLMIVLLLLLMSADSSEDKNSALLTLALYLFL